MTVVTLDGHIGSGAQEVGLRLAERLSADYYDRLLLLGVARRIGATMSALELKERQNPRIVQRMSASLMRAMEGMSLRAAEYDAELFELAQSTRTGRMKTTPEAVNDHELVKAYREELHEIARRGSAVIVHRGGCAVLRDEPEALRVGLFAGWDERVRRIMRMDRIADWRRAERVLRCREERQVQYFQVLGAHPHNLSMYDVVIDTGLLGIDASVDAVVRWIQFGDARDVKVEEVV
ncbi:MAG: cytidylate kinase family protein [Dehalococcoidia bacterium]